MKVVRVLVYEGPKEWLQDQLRRSLPDGTKVLRKGQYITAVTMPSMALAVDRLWWFIKNVLKGTGVDKP